MAEPDWAKLLDYLYKIPGDLYVSEASTPQNEPIDRYFQNKLRENIDFSSKVDEETIFGYMLRDMQENNLIEVERNQSSVTLSMTEKGFNVAHEREQNKKSQYTNKSINRLTWVLAIAAMIQALSAVFTVDPPAMYFIAIGSVFLLVFGAVGIKYGPY